MDLLNLTYIFHADDDLEVFQDEVSYKSNRQKPVIAGRVYRLAIAECTDQGIYI